MAEKITLETLAAQIAEGFAKHTRETRDLSESVGFVVKHMATKDDIGDIKHEKATKEQLIALHGQVNAIETQLRGMRPVKLRSRVADLEEEVFGRTRA
jgi:hypothetical protein